MLLAFLGVDRETIIKDYLYTNQNVTLKSNLAYVGLLLAKHSHRLASKIKHYFMAEPGFINASLSQLEKDYGSLENFFNQKLGFTDKETQDIKNKFLI